MRGSLHVLLLHNNSIINELQCIFIVRNMKQKAISLLKSSVQIIINQTTSLKQTSLEKSYLDSFHLLLHSRSFEELAFANCFGLVTFREVLLTPPVSTDECEEAFSVGIIPLQCIPAIFVNVDPKRAGI